MEIDSNTHNIRKIEDIIDIQKANGNIHVRQVAFSLPHDNSNVEISSVNSYESELCMPQLEGENHQKTKENSQFRSKRKKSEITGPSDSDITVLRMKMCKEDSSNVILGDGLHLPDNSSMVNLATLMLKSQSSFANGEEYLMPLSSWEHAKTLTNSVEESPKRNIDVTAEDVSSSNNRCPENKSSKVAKFFRLYFCPCSSHLYEIEKMQDDPSVYMTYRGNENNS